MTPREAAALVAAIAAAYPQWNASAETVAVYADALSDLNAAEAHDAVKQIIKTSERWPTIATIRRTVAHRTGRLAPSPAEAWGEVQQRASTHGRSAPPEWSHYSIAAAVRVIGWWNICHSMNPETLRSQFLRIYEELRTASDNEIIGGAASTPIAETSPSRSLGSGL